MPIIKGLSAELVELSMKHHGKTVVVDIIADKINGGITVDECSTINKQVVRAIESQQWFSENFIVEVSSPGLDRALKTAQDFTRAIGRKVRIHLLEPVEEKVEHQGIVARVQENFITIQKKDAMVNIPLEYISKAVQMIE
jgi:ribosome maturation factor RimP